MALPAEIPFGRVSKPHWGIPAKLYRVAMTLCPRHIMSH